MVETPTIDRYMGIRARAAERAYRELKREHNAWLGAYKSHDVKRAEELARIRDATAMKVIRVYQKADTFLQGICSMWDIRY